MEPETEKSVDVRGSGRGAGDQGWQTSNLTSLLNGIAETLGGVSITEAMQNAVALLCCDVLAQDISKAPPYLRKRQRYGSSTIVSGGDHQIARMFALDPNKRHTWIEFTAMAVYWLKWRSNSFVLIKRKRNGDISQLIPLQTSQVLPLVNTQSRETFYEITASTEHEMALLGFRTKRVAASEMIHIRDRMVDGFSGTPTLDLGGPTLKTSAAMEKFRTDMVGDAGYMRGVFHRKDPGELSEPAFQRLRKQLSELMNLYASRKEPLILEDGMVFQETKANPAELELAKQFDNQVVSVCRLFRVPPHKAFHLINVKYENMEVLEKSYLGDTLDPILKALEQRFTRALLSETDRVDGLFIEYDRSELTLRDPKVMMEQTKAFVSLGMITFGEGRVEHGWEPGPMADHRIIPTNSTLIDGAMKPVEGLKPEPKPTAEPDPAEPKKYLKLVEN
jgi:HK97 family phage portal protein